MYQAVGPCPHCVIKNDMSACSRTYDISGLISSYFIYHNISFNCSLHVPNCSCYQSRPCKYRLIEVYSSSAHISLLIYSVFIVLTCSDCHWLTSLFFDWPCASLSLVSNWLLLHESSLLIARLALIVSVYRCYSCLCFVALFCFVPFSVFFSLFLCFSLFSYENSKVEGSHVTGWL